MGANRKELQLPQHGPSPYFGSAGKGSTLTAGACWPVMRAIRRSPRAVGCTKILFLISTRPSWISGTSCSNSFLTSPGCVRETTIDGPLAVLRTSMLQLAAPEDMRGRMQGVFIVVVAGGPRLGDVRAGAMAAVVGL